jgi:hypothetical protein
VETIMPTPEEKVFVQEHLRDEVSALALRLGRFPHLNASTVLRQVAGYQSLARKVPSWYANPDLIFPDSLPLEQCSSEATAAYKTALLDRIGPIASIADLTGGFGVDFAFMATRRARALYVDRREDLCLCAAHNFKALGLTAEILQGDGPSLLADSSYTFDLIFIDPARRDAKGGKVVALSDSEPDLTQIKEGLLSRASFVLAKISPMLDLSLALSQLPETVEVHVVSVDGECKELLFLLSREVLLEEPRIFCVNLRSRSAEQHFVFTRTEEQDAQCRYIPNPSTYLYEPNASLLKAGAFSILTQSFDLYKLHPNSHLYTSEVLIADFPGRIFSVESVMSVHQREWKKQLAGLTKANITTRNFPESVDALRKKTSLKDGGETYLFATTLLNGKKVFLKCRKVES